MVSLSGDRVWPRRPGRIASGVYALGLLTWMHCSYLDSEENSESSREVEMGNCAVFQQMCKIDLK